MIIRSLSRAEKATVRTTTLTVIGWLLVGCGLPVHVLADHSRDVSPIPLKARQIVAAGFGIQDAESSSITVKTYDADTGEVLSDESYELDIKEEGTAGSGQPRERIFAGGVGIGADGLSGFTLRVYDAADGRFLWEGRLNLGMSTNDAETVPVAALIQPRGAISKISRNGHRDGQPSFLLRVVDPKTKQLVWSDRFSTETSSVRVERIGRTVAGMAQEVPRDVEFRIQMFDDAGGELLWEDQVTPAAEGSSASSRPQEEEAGMIPQWSNRRDLSVRETI